MLQKNHLNPPLPFQPSRATAAPVSHAAGGDRFVSAGDFDATGVLAGVDPCESRYWWMPELLGPDTPATAARNTLAQLLAGGPLQATSRPTSRPTAAA